MKEKDKRKQTIKISIFITSILIILFSMTYAFINVTLTGTRGQVITAGNLSLELVEDNEIKIDDAFPMYDEVGMIQDSFNFKLTNNTPLTSDYTVKLVDITDSNVEKLDLSMIKYGLTKDGVVTIGKLSELENLVIDTGTINGNETIEYSLRLWIDSRIEDNDLISGKILKYRINVYTRTDTTIQKASEKLFLKGNLGNSCKTYDDGVDTFLVGQCSKNYIWYSGKLWRVVLRNNETGVVKMITDNSITAIPYNTSGKTAFENSYADQWLQQEFLPTLHDYEHYLVLNSAWDATTDTSSAPVRPTKTTVVYRAVGLLNAYEYYTTYARSDNLAISTTGYLNNNEYWRLLTPQNSSDTRIVSHDSTLSVYTSVYGMPLRPSINLKSEIQIIAGEGTISNPYILAEDRKEIVEGITPLNTRYSGEYIKFNHELYRIVDIENSLIKITAVNKPSALKENKFHSKEKVSSFANASIKSDLENYYQKLDTTVQNMIEKNTTWYLGAVGDAVNYKASICATVDVHTSSKDCSKTTSSVTANIALPRVGEMFTSLIFRDEKIDFWLLTPFSSDGVCNMRFGGNLSRTYPIYGYGARPSLYLKENVVISKDNTGDGTYEHPYSIELES